MGVRDPRHNKLGKLDFFLGQQLATYVKQDPLPTQFRPIPVSVLQVLDVAFQRGMECQRSIIDLTWIAFFFSSSQDSTARTAPKPTTALVPIGKIFTSVGVRDPRHNKLGKLDFFLGQQLATYVKQDPLPTQFRPIPVSVLQVLDVAFQRGMECQRSIIDLTWIAFFFSSSQDSTARTAPKPTTALSSSYISSFLMDSSP